MQKLINVINAAHISSKLLSDYQEKWYCIGEILWIDWIQWLYSSSLYPARYWRSASNGKFGDRWMGLDWSRKSVIVIFSFFGCQFLLSKSNLCFAGTNRSEALLKAYVNTVPLEECNQTLIQNNLADLPSLRGLSRSQMCASNLAEGSDACQGDSGGPIFQHHQHSGFSVLIGIVSFGVSCGTELPGVYTRIAFYADWIESIVWP